MIELGVGYLVLRFLEVHQVEGLRATVEIPQVDFAGVAGEEMFVVAAAGQMLNILFVARLVLPNELGRLRN